MHAVLDGTALACGELYVRAAGAGGAGGPAAGWLRGWQRRRHIREHLSGAPGNPQRNARVLTAGMQASNLGLKSRFAGHCIREYLWHVCSIQLIRKVFLCVSCSHCSRLRQVCFTGGHVKQSCARMQRSRCQSKLHEY